MKKEEEEQDYFNIIPFVMKVTTLETRKHKLSSLIVSQCRHEINTKTVDEETWIVFLTQAGFSHLEQKTRESTNTSTYSPAFP